MPAKKNIAVFGIYPDQLTAEDALETLKDAGFRSTDISVLFPDSQDTRNFAHEKHTNAPEGAVFAGDSAAVMGGALGWLSGIGALAVPGAGHFIAAGPLMGMLGGIGLGGAACGLAGALIGLEIPEPEMGRYERRIRHGGILLSVHCDNTEKSRRAKNILNQTGAEDVAGTKEAAADFTVSARPVRRGGSYPLYDHRG